MTGPIPRSHSQIGRANLEKSKVAERALATYLRTHGWPGAERTVRTGYRVDGRTFGDHGDVDGTPGVAWQMKVTDDRRLHLVPAWLAETDAQRGAAGADYGVLVIKRAGHAHPGTWWAYLELSAFLALVDADYGLTTAGSSAQPVPGAIRLELASVVAALHWAGYGTAQEAA